MISLVVWAIGSFPQALWVPSAGILSCFDTLDVYPYLCGGFQNRIKNTTKYARKR